jgi:hypothetical protein
MKSFTLSLLLAIACCGLAHGQVNKRVHTNIKIPVNLMPLVAEDAIEIEDSVAYDHANLALVWNFVPIDGDMTQVAVTPTNTGGDYDWTAKGRGFYQIEMPESGGASMNNDAEGFGWLSGGGDDSGLLPFRSPIIRFSGNPRELSFDPLGG